MSTSMGLICSEHFSAGVCCKREIISTQGTDPGSCSDRGHHGPVTASGPASLRASLLGVRESMGLGCTGSPLGDLAAPCTAGSLHPAPLCAPSKSPPAPACPGQPGSGCGQDGACRGAQLEAEAAGPAAASGKPAEMELSWGSTGGWVLGSWVPQGPTTPGRDRGLHGKMGTCTARCLTWEICGPAPPLCAHSWMSPKWGCPHGLRNLLPLPNPSRGQASQPVGAHPSPSPLPPTPGGGDAVRDEHPAVPVPCWEALGGCWLHPAGRQCSPPPQALGPTKPWLRAPKGWPRVGEAKNVP